MYTEQPALFPPDVLQARIDVLTEKLVPEEGPADTLEGELIRAINKIGYRYYNDGDYWYREYGCETAGPAAAFLSQHGPDLKSDIRQSQGKTQHSYERALFAIMEKIVDHVESQNGKYTENKYDMLTFYPLVRVR